MSEATPILSTFGLDRVGYGGALAGPFAQEPTFGNLRGVSPRGTRF